MLSLLKYELCLTSFECVVPLPPAILQSDLLHFQNKEIIFRSPANVTES